MGGLEVGFWDVLKLESPAPCLMQSGRVKKKVASIWANVCTPAGREKFLPQALDCAVAEVRDGRVVVVHCVWGRHRTTAFLACVSAMSNSAGLNRKNVQVCTSRSREHSVGFKFRIS